MWMRELEQNDVKIKSLTDTMCRGDSTSSTLLFPNF
jgi:hypothetical protein